jgi:hypothetical protein
MQDIRDLYRPDRLFVLELDEDLATADSRGVLGLSQLRNTSGRVPKGRDMKPGTRFYTSSLALAGATPADDRDVGGEEGADSVLHRPPLTFITSTDKPMRPRLEIYKQTKADDPQSSFRLQTCLPLYYLS